MSFRVSFASVMRKIASYLTKNRSETGRKIAQSTHENENIKLEKTFCRNSKQFLKWLHRIQEEGNPRLCVRLPSFFVGLPGLEPGKTGPESVVLPLHHSPIQLFSLLGYQDSNLEKQDQNLLCYHYTIAQFRISTAKVATFFEPTNFLFAFFTLRNHSSRFRRHVAVTLPLQAAARGHIT